MRHMCITHYRFILILMILFSCFFVGPSAAADICFSESDSERILMELERARINDKIITELQAIQGEYEIQIQTLNNDIMLLREQIEKDNGLIGNLDKMSREQDIICQEMIKEASPSFFEKLGWAGAGAGFMVVVLLIIGL